LDSGKTTGNEEKEEKRKTTKNKRKYNKQDVTEDQEQVQEEASTKRYLRTRTTERTGAR